MRDGHSRLLVRCNLEFLLGMIFRGTKRRRRPGLLSPTLFSQLLQSIAFPLGLGESLPKKGVLLLQLLVLLLQTFGNILQGNIAFNLPLLVLLHASLEVCKLRLLALTECSLCRPADIFGLRLAVHVGFAENETHLFCTLRPFESTFVKHFQK